MAEIHPNDIGLATYADVGDVENLRTSAKTIVAAINEIYSNGGGSGDLFTGEQWYVDGDNNIILGKNNIVYGNNNLIIGSDNVIVGDGHNIINCGLKLHKPVQLSADYYNINTGKINISIYDDSQPLNVGDKVLISISSTWMTEDWFDQITTIHGPIIATVSEVNYRDNYIRVDGLEVSKEPPDAEHINHDIAYVELFVPLNDTYKKIAVSNSIIFGNNSDGNKSTSFGLAAALGNYAFAANNSKANGDVAASFNHGQSNGSNSFSANNSESNAEYSAAFNKAECNSPLSVAVGNYTKIFGRPLKCTNVNWITRELTIDPISNLTDINSGTKIVFRCFNVINSIMFREYTIESITGNIIKLDDSFVQDGAGSYKPQILPDRIIYVLDDTNTYSTSNFAGGTYSVSGGKNGFTYGNYLTNKNEGAVIFGKYGITDSDYSINLGNGTNMQNLGLAFKVTNSGNVYADGEYSSPCADYAECFEWLDGNPDNEERCGYFVKLENGKITKCSDFDTPLGVVSATPAILGDSADLHWHDKYITDDFGRIQYHDVIVPEEKDEDGNVIIEEHTEHQPILNPDWDNETEYIPRSERPEWDAVGVLGKLIVYDDGTLQSGDVCRCGDNGKAVKSVKNGYPVLKRISDDKVLIWFKG